MIERPDDWTSAVLRAADNGKPVIIVVCPVCGAVLLSSDTMGMARHALWHHNRGEWPWAEM